MAAPALEQLVTPGVTALVTQELQGAVVGPESQLGFAEIAAAEMLPNVARLLPVARAADVRVVHCLVQRRPDGLGSNHNARLFGSGRKRSTHLAPGSPGASLLPELGPAPDDLVLSRWHGVGPMGGTDLDSILRNLGVTTVVFVGVSVNVAITNAVMDAVNRGYQVVVPADAVAGVPVEYAWAVIANTLSLLATVTTTDDLIAAWSNEVAG